MEFERKAVLKTADESKQLIYCVVLAPDVEDLQGDVMSADDIEKAAHQYALDSRVVGLNHLKKADGSVVKAQAEVVETYIAPVDFEINGELITKGTWVMGIKIHDENMWYAYTTGEFDGLSIGGSGVRTEL